jgi:type I restriction enzyme S subunit
MAFNQTCYAILPKNNLDNDFLFYALKGTMIEMRALTYGTVFETITINTFDHWLIPLPPLPVQRAIAHILGTLDDKIELNRKMNETLEQMARALFKCWFIDFEPVRAKMEGRWKKGQSLPGLPAHLYDFFPNELETSELGKVPKGSKIIRLGDILSEIVTGSRPKGGATEKGLPSLGAENVIGLGKYDFTKDKFIPRSYFEQLKQKGAIIKDGDILLYKDGAQIGRKSYFDHGFPHSECAVNEHVFILRSKYPFLQRYLFFWLDQPWMTSEIINLNSNSAQPGINQAGIIQLSILFPSEVIIKSFDQIIEPIITHIFSNCHETQKLTALRDTILPKLIHREIHIKDAEKFLQKEGL